MYYIVFTFFNRGKKVVRKDAEWFNGITHKFDYLYRGLLCLHIKLFSRLYRIEIWKDHELLAYETFKKYS